MRNFKFIFSVLLIMASVVLTSCGKGYDVRFTNYNTEVIDTVIIGKNSVVFSQIERLTTTDYKKISTGNQTIKCITKTKKIYSSSISIPKKGTGKRTIQIDGLNSISILED